VKADQTETFDGERVLWSGQPVRFPVFDVVGVLLTTVGIYCIAGAVFSIVAGIRDDNPITVVLAALIALCVLAVIIGRPLLRRSNLRTTRYVLTGSRIVVATTVAGRRVLVAHLRDLSPPMLSMRAGTGIGTIRFDGSTVVLLEIENARQVHHLIITAQADGT
jgi:membrane protein implicated in regulation of membrane protease activity